MLGDPGPEGTHSGPAVAPLYTLVHKSPRAGGLPPMTGEFLLASEAALRLSAFLGVFVLMLALETLWPCRPRSLSRRRRWPANLGILALDSAAVRALFPTAAVGVAAWADGAGHGLLQVLAAPGWLAFVGTVIVLDLVIYAQHVAFHYVPPLWRVHRMHHADVDVDVTTGGRFHPIEIVLSMGLKVLAVIALGAPPAAVLVFEVLLNGTSMFNHANLHLPPALDRVLRWILVTPDMHRVHHSVVPRETNSNFGFNLPWWDRLFRTYRQAPEAGYEAMTTGLAEFRQLEESGLGHLLTQPFRESRRDGRRDADR